jgi:hypothetical protein
VPDGYEADTEVYSVTLTPGQVTTLRLSSTPKSGFRLKKVDSVTKEPIAGVEFMLFDRNGKQEGTYYTDNNGVIDFSGELSAGRYTLRETRPADGYYNDTEPRTVEFVSGRVTEVLWENTPQMGQIQIVSKSGNDGEVNGLPAGTLLEGVIFEAYAYKSGNLIDRFISGTDGRAVSKPLPIGRYIVKAVQTPDWYRSAAASIDVDIEFATQIIKREMVFEPINTGVSTKMQGNVEAMPTDEIAYTVKDVKNTSTVPLETFYWRDTLPTDAVRLSKIVTGTYNQSLKYKIVAATSSGNQIVITDNLSTTVNNVVDCRELAIGLASGEYITNVSLMFGTVKAGFAQVEAPKVYVYVQNNLTNGYEFVNKVDAGGIYNSEWVVTNSTWSTKIYAPAGKLPRTGY